MKLTKRLSLIFKITSFIQNLHKLCSLANNYKFIYVFFCTIFNFFIKLLFKNIIFQILYLISNFNLRIKIVYLCIYLFRY